MRRPLILAVLAALLSGCSVSVGFGVETGGVTEIQPPQREQTPAGQQPAVTSRITTPETAGGLTRARDTETRISDQLTRGRAQVPATAIVAGSLVSAVYHRPGIAPPDGDIVFIGGGLVDPAPLMTALRGTPERPGWRSSEVDPGPGGGQAACAEGPNSGGLVVPSCLWVAGDSFGQLVPLVPRSKTPTVPTMTELAELMRQMRPDLEPA